MTLYVRFLTLYVELLNLYVKCDLSVPFFRYPTKNTLRKTIFVEGKIFVVEGHVDGQQIDVDVEFLVTYVALYVKHSTKNTLRKLVS